jgi:DUF4097 and DUF4098 domain-containing protein YvlB
VGWLIAGVAAIILAIGLATALIVALVAGVLGGLGAGVTRTSVTTRTFAVAGTPSLVIHDTAGNVTLRTGDASRVTIQITKTVHTIDGTAADRALGNTAVTATQNGNTINVSAQFQSSWFDGLASRRSVDLVVTVPSNANVDTTLTAGNFEATGISGALLLTDTAGNVTTTGATFADGSRVDVTAGNATLDGALTPGASLDVHVTAGNATLRLPAGTQAHVDASTTVGDVQVSGWPLTVSNAGLTGHSAVGDLGTNPSGTITVRVTTGNVTLAHAE